MRTLTHAHHRAGPSCAQHYGEAKTLLPKMMELLKRFMNRTHQSLAAVGVAALVRMVNNAAAVMSKDEWLQVRAQVVACSSAPDCRCCAAGQSCVP